MTRIIILLLILPITVWASESVKSTEIVSTEEKYSLEAERWNISVEEYTRYKDIMAGEGQYHWQGADPLTVLGIYAETDAERDRYAELIARTEFRLNTAFLKLNEAYVNAFHRLYGYKPIIDVSRFYSKFRANNISASVGKKSNREGNRKSVLGIGDHYVMFLSPGCKGCRDQFNSLLAQKPVGTVLDLYFVNTTEKEIMKWASDMKIDPKLVNDGAITLNPGNEVYTQFDRPPLPAAFYYDGNTSDITPVGR